MSEDTELFVPVPPEWACCQPMPEGLKEQDYERVMALICCDEESDDPAD